MKIIGLDIGSYSLKAIEIEVGLRQLDIIDFFEEKLPPSSDPPKPEHIREALKLLLIKNNIVPPYKMISALTGSLVSTRQLSLPFTDKTKIKQTLPFELEEHIPFSLEDIAFDYQIISQREKTTQVLVLITSKEILRERLEFFETPDSSPDILTMDAISLYNLTKLSWEEPPEVYAFLNIGHTQTAICTIDDGKINQVRSLSGAGQAATLAIQETYKLSLEDAEKAKIGNGFVLTDSKGATADQVKFSDCIKKALDPLISQINQTFQSNRSHGRGIVRKIFLTGGGSLLRNLPAYLSQELHVEVELLKSLNSYPSTNIASNDENNAKTSQALALALGAVGRNYSEQFNFRKGEFSKYPSGPLGKEVRYFLALGSLIIAILFMNMIGNFIILRSTYNKINQQTKVIIKKFPIKVPENLLETPSQLRAYLNKKSKEQKEKLEALGGTKTDTLTILQTLQQISSQVPKDQLFDVRELSIVEGKIKIKAISDSFNTIENIEKSFKNNPKFTKVVKGEISTSADGKNKDFTLTYDLKNVK